MKITYITADPTVSKEQLRRLTKLAGEKVEVLNRKKMTSEETVKTMEHFEVLIGGSSGFGYLDKDVLGKLPQLKLISILGVGTDWVDLEAARKLGITVCNAKGANSESVAEHVWGMIISLSKKITEADRDIRQEGAFRFIPYEGVELFGKTLGIIGLGEIGSKVARIAKGFEMKVVGVSKSGKAVDGVKVIALDELFKESDVVAVCASQNPETENMITSAEIGKMKRGVILVSSSREILIDQKAVVAGLESGKIFGFGQDLDIMRKIDDNDPLLKFSNVIFTPHNAFFTKEADYKTDDVAIDNVEAYIKGKPVNVVN